MMKFVSVAALGATDQREDQVILSFYGSRGGTVANIGILPSEASALQSKLAAICPPAEPAASEMWAFVQQVARLCHSDDPEQLGEIDPSDSHATLDSLIHKARAIAAPVLA